MSFTSPLPGDLLPGTYRLMAVVDGNHENHDLDRGNNLKVWNKEIRIQEGH